MRPPTGKSDHPLRLLAFGMSWPPETFLQRKLTGLAAAGIDVTAAVKPPREPSQTLLHGVKVVRLGSLRPATFIAVATSPRRALSAVLNSIRFGVGPFKKRVLRLRNLAPFIGMNPDVVHFEWNAAAIDYLPFLRLWRAPIVISCRGTQVFIRPHVSAGYQDLLRRTFATADAVHCVCDAIRDEAVTLGLDPIKATVIRPAVDTDEFRPAHRESGAALHIVAIGALNWRKGYEYMLVTFRRALDEGVSARLSIVGSGDDAPRIRYAIEEMDLEPHVTLYGGLSPQAIRDLLNTADMFLHSSLGEGISNAVLEAMACGLPIVTTDSGGMREAVTDGHDGFVLAVRDVDAAVRAIATLASDASLRSRMGHNARETADTRFRLEDQIADFKALYEVLVVAPTGT